MRNKYESTVTECSKDDYGNSLVDDNTKVYSLDDYAKDIGTEYRSKKKYPASADVFAFGEGNQLYLIEFKNARKSKIHFSMLASKAFDSMYLLQLFLDGKYSVKTLAERTVFCVVYRDDFGNMELQENPSASFQKFKDKIGTLAQISGRNILFGLEKYKDWLYKEIYTIGEKEFRELLLPKLYI